MTNLASSLWLNAGRTLNIGHRGASAAAPPNTMAAFRRAVEMRADGVELDVHLSSDGIPVVIHDFSVDATTNGTGQVTDLSLAELKKLDAGSSFDPQFAGERIPTLDEVFAGVGQELLINVELKAKAKDDRGMGEAVVELIERYGLIDRVLISSFNPYAIRRVRQLAPDLAIGLLYAPTFLFGITRLMARFMRDMDLQTVHPHWSMVRPVSIARAHRRGRRVATWTVDDPDRMRRLISWGTDAIITNYPDRLRDVLDKFPREEL